MTRFLQGLGFLGAGMFIVLMAHWVAEVVRQIT